MSQVLHIDLSEEPFAQFPRASETACLNKAVMARTRVERERQELDPRME